MKKEVRRSKVFTVKALKNFSFIYKRRALRAFKEVKAQKLFKSILQ